MILQLLSCFLLLTFSITLILEIRFFVYSFYDLYRYLISFVDRFKKKKILFILSILLLAANITFTLLSYPLIGVILSIISLIPAIIEVPKVKVKFTRRNITLMVANLLIIGTIYLLLIKFDIAKYLAIIINYACVPIVLFLSYILASPSEYLIQLHYIKAAKKKIKDNPKLKIIGITGSYGKTTFKNSLKTLLSQERVLSSPGNINTPMGLVKFINDKLSPVDTILILELGIDRVNGMKKFKRIFNLDYAVITSVGLQHIRTMRSLSNIYKAKTDIVTLLKPGGIIVYNKDAVKESSKLREPRIEYGKEGYVLLDKDGFKTLRHKSTLLQTKLTSLSAINHSFGAYLLSKEILHNKGNLEQRFSEIKEVTRRKKTILKDGVIIIDDSYNINPQSSKESFDLAFKHLGKKAVVTAGLVELGRKFKQEHYEFGKNLAAFDSVFYVGKIDRATYQGFKDNNGNDNKIIHIKCIEEVYKRIQGIEVLLILPLGGGFSLS